jgi:nucleoside-diphosphate-sugar epimerase
MFITGAAGFLGQYVVARALRDGHEVAALIRPGTSRSRTPWIDHPALTQVTGDLRRAGDLVEAIGQCDVVVHLAAAKSGGFYDQLGGTVVATESLLSAMCDADVKPIVVTSSFAVYDYQQIRTRATLDEATPTEADPLGRDDYCQTKLLQERLIREAHAEDAIHAVIVRPGVIYGPGNLWNARLGMQAGRTWIRTGANARLPLVYVEHCATALLAAATHAVEADRGDDPLVLNLLDDDPPSQRRYMKLLQRRAAPKPRIVPINYTLLRMTSNTIDLVNRALFRGQVKVPSLLRPAALLARLKPLRFANARIKQTLNWSPDFSLEQAIDRSQTGEAAATLTLDGAGPQLRLTATDDDPDTHRGAA